MDDEDDEIGEIRAVSAEVCYDGSVAVQLAVPGYDEPVETTFPGNEHTLLMTWDAARPIDLEGTTAADRRVQEIVARGVARLNEDLARQRTRQERLWREHQARADEIYVG
jgi:hypothetical protein